MRPVMGIIVYGISLEMKMASTIYQILRTECEHIQIERLSDLSISVHLNDKKRDRDYQENVETPMRPRDHCGQKS
jgi:hypothetical protein